MDRNQERDERFKDLDEECKTLYGAPEGGAFMYTTFQQFQLTEEIYTEYAQIIGDTILGFYKIADMPKLFQQKLGVSADVSQKMTSELIEFLSAVVKREQEEATVKKESLATLTQTFATPAVPIQATAEVPKPPVEHITQMRTMQSDLNRIHGYGAYQQSREAIQKEETVATSSQEELLDKK